MNMQSQSHWYIGAQGSQTSNPAEGAFQDALSVFQLDSTKQKSFDKLQHSKSLTGLQQLVETAQSKYDKQHQDKIVRWLSKLSSRISHYGRVLDVLVQHHPEYVSLAWGAMKFLFILVENHEKQLKALAKGLTRIADVLPRVELVNTLYPTARMRAAVSQLYSHIIQFFLRAERWYQIGKSRHAWEALSRPVELHYNDLIGDIQDCATEIEALANGCAKAEQRDIHSEIQDLSQKLRAQEALLQEMRGLLLVSQSVQTSANLDTNQRLTDLQLNQIMDYLSGADVLDPMKALQCRTFMSARGRGRQQTVETESRFWNDAKFNSWESSSNPSMIMVKGDYANRLQVQKFTIEIINTLRDQKIPVLWVLKPLPAQNQPATAITDIIKAIVCQAIQLNIALHTERALSLSCAQFRAAETPEEWLDLLAKVIATFPRLYIVIDTETAAIAYSTGFSWLAQLSALFQRHNNRKWISCLKILLVSYGSMAIQNTDLSQYRDVVVHTRSLASRGWGRSIRGSTLPGRFRGRQKAR
ncbi:hypothetical protein BCR34DRAFT_607470 [Clohesyomyces aquaticus]|uniref:DUF7708 domain-containing protein n=1 Tax=Clohesyomyces aquaticus TaxID=1231657 RepID=A0A1Y1YH74_9PLEO|nr:hypothetical protein BCR34DRAFT_607470 [Clohesyomyces aquaticus]